MHCDLQTNSTSLDYKCGQFFKNRIMTTGLYFRSIDGLLHQQKAYSE